jgi:hypothetical protein
VEFEREPDDLDRFIDVLDEKLRAINSDYDAKRTNDMTIARPLLRAVPNGTFYDWLKRKGKLGGQHKIPRLSNDRTYLDDVLEQVLEQSSTT